MSLAIAAALGSMALIIVTQINKRNPDRSAGLNGVIRLLIIIVIGLVAAYFYQRITA